MRTKIRSVSHDAVVDKEVLYSALRPMADLRHDALLGFTDKLPFDHRRPPYGETGRPNARAKKPLVLAKLAVVVLSPPSPDCS